MRCRIHFDDIGMPAFHDGLAMHARLGEIDRRLAAFVVALEVQAARQDPRRRRLADAAHACQHPGMGNAAGGEGVAQGAHHRRLADEIVEARRAVFARQNLVGAARTGAVAAFTHGPVIRRSVAEVKALGLAPAMRR